MINKNLVSFSDSYTLTSSESLIYTVYPGIKYGEILLDTKTIFSVESTNGEASLTIDGTNLRGIFRKYIFCEIL